MTRPGFYFLTMADGRPKGYANALRVAVATSVMLAAAGHPVPEQRVEPCD